MKKKILIVDDEPFYIEAFTLQLTQAGFEVCPARNGAEAVTKAKTEKPDLIIMDVIMPVMSGFDATQKIHNDPAAENIPIIIFTSRAAMGDFFTGMRKVEVLSKSAGVDAVVIRTMAITGTPPPAVGNLKRTVLLGVEDALVDKVRNLLKKFNYEVFPALNEKEAVTMIETLKPASVFCQLWEDNSVLDAPKIARDLAQSPAILNTSFYVYCKEALSVEAMKHFKTENILVYKESSDLLKKLEELLSKKENIAL